MKKKSSLLIVMLFLVSMFSGFSPSTPGYAEEPEPIGYRIGGDVVEIWNPDTTYYFNKTSGIQWTEDPDQYWTRNIFAVGYYSGGEWHKIYSADELGSFNREIESDYSTYVNATLWKDFTYAGYELRLGIRYHLKLEDTELSVIIYAKNLDTEDYPYPLGLAWTVTDIDIPNPLGQDRVYINETYYRLEDIHDVTFTDMRKKTEGGTEPAPHYRISDYTQFITLEWKHDIPYSVRLQFNGAQEDARITWTVNAGIFKAGQEKSTTLFWADAEGDYIGSWPLNGANLNCRGITYNGTYLFVSDDPAMSVFIYETDGTFIDSWALHASNTVAAGIGSNGSHVFVSDLTDDMIYVYTSDGVYGTKWDVNALSNDPYGVTSDGTSIWVGDSGTDEVFRYNMAGVYQDKWALELPANDLPFGITNNDTHIWVIDSTDDSVYRYLVDGTYQAVWACNGANAQPRSITTNGTHFFIADLADDVYVYEHNIPNETPTLTSASIPDMNDTDNCYEMADPYYSFVAVVNDADGATDIDKVYLQGKQGGAVRFEVRATDLTGAPAWAIQTGAAIIDLDTGSCTWAEDGNSGTATFKIRFEWDYTDEADCEITVYVEDSKADSAGFTEMQTDYFDVIGRLVTHNFGTNASGVPINTPIELSGFVRYATTVGGDLASSSYPPDAQFTAVEIHNDQEEQEGTDAAIVNGAFSVIFDSYEIPRTTIYYAYLDLLADYVDGLAPDEDMVYVTTVTEFYLSELIEDAFGVFGILEYLANATAYGTALGAYFIDSISNIMQLITQQFLLVLGIFDFFIDWYTRMVSLVISIGNAITGLLDGTGDITTGLGDIWEFISFSTWIDIVPVFLFIWWVESIATRGERQGEITVFFGDLSTVFNVTSWLLSMFGLIINTVTDLAFRLLGVIT